MNMIKGNPHSCQEYSHSCRSRSIPAGMTRFRSHSCRNTVIPVPLRRIPVPFQRIPVHSSGFRCIPAESGHSCRNMWGSEKYCFSPSCWAQLAGVSVGGKTYLGSRLIIIIYSPLSAAIGARDGMDGGRANWITFPK
jgi:hypothetical protein